MGTKRLPTWHAPGWLCPTTCATRAEGDATRARVAKLEAALSDIIADEQGCCYASWDTTCAKRGDPEPCHYCIAADALAGGAQTEAPAEGGDDRD